jgi:hypothetical protein
MAWCTRGIAFLAATAICGGGLTYGLTAYSDPLPPDTTYRPLPTRPLSEIKADDEAQKPRVMTRQSSLLNQRYDLGDRPLAGVMMSGGKKAVQGGVRVKLPPDIHLGQPGRDESRRNTRAELAARRLPAAAACEAGNRRTGISRPADRRNSSPGEPRTATLRR